MNKLFDIESYKNHLINVYRYEVDRNKVLERKIIINNMNQLLIKVLQNTQYFIPYLLEQIKNENDNFYGEFLFKIDIDEVTQNIYNGCSGGFPSDTLVHPLSFERDMWISLYLLKKVFENFTIYEDYDEVEEMNEDESVGITYCCNKIIINGEMREFQKIYKNFFQEQDIKRVHVKK